MTYWINGAYQNNPIGIDISDRGLLIGDGAFETILVVNAVPAFLDAHIKRLGRTLEALDIRYEGDFDVSNTVTELADRNGLGSSLASARLTVTRGPGGRGLVYNEKASPTVLLTLAPYAPPPNPPAKLLISKYIRFEISINSRYKTTNYLENLMARNEAEKAGYDDALMLNSLGSVACASAANIFAVMPDGAIVTPPIFDGALPGIIREILLNEAPRAGLPIEERSILPEELSEAGIFLTNSLIGIRAATLSSSTTTDNHDKILRLQLLYDKLLGQETNRKASDF